MKLKFEEADKLNHPQDAFTHARAAIAYECVDRIFGRLPRGAKAGLIGELNDALLFIAAADRQALDEPAKEYAKESDEPATQ